MESAAVFTLRLMKKLAEGCALQQLLEEAAKLGLRDVSVCDAAYNLLAYSHELRDDHVFIRQASGKLVMCPESIASMQRKQISRRLAKMSRPFWFYNEQLGQWELFCAVLYNEQVLGYLFHRPERPPTDDEVVCWTALSQGVAITMQRSGGIEPDAGQKMQETVFQQLALGQMTDFDLAQARLEQSGWSAVSSYRVGCLFTSEASLFSALSPKQLSAQLRNVFPGCICCCYQDHLILLGPEDLETAPHRDTRLRHWLKFHHFRIAASMPFSSLSGTAAAYRQAKELVKAGRALSAHADAAPEILYYEDQLPLCAYLSAYGEGELSAHIHPHIVRLAAHDAARGTKYIDTLAAYFAAGRSMTEASKALFVHKTTLFYRFERMEKLVGPFMGDQRLLFSYEYSLRLLKALGES